MSNSLWISEETETLLNISDKNETLSLMSPMNRNFKIKKLIVLVGKYEWESVYADIWLYSQLMVFVFLFFHVRNQAGKTLFVSMAQLVKCSWAGGI